MQEEASGFAAFVGIDWADRKHDVCLQVPGTDVVEASVVEHRPKAIEEWAHRLRERFAGQRIAVCLELSHGPIVSALLEHDIFVIYPVNPSTLAKYRRAFTPSRAKDDPTDAAIALELLRCHRDKLKPLRHESPNMRALRRLVEARRDLVQDRVRITNRLTFTLKAYFPQVLEWFRDKETDVFAAFLERWPSLPDAQRARRDTIVDFFHAHSVRRASVIERRLEAIKSERPLTSDAAVIEPARLLVEVLLPQLRAVSAGIQRLDHEIARRCQQLPDYFLFADLPGAGPSFPHVSSPLSANNVTASPTHPPSRSTPESPPSQNAAETSTGSTGAGRAQPSCDRPSSNGSPAPSRTRSGLFLLREAPGQGASHNATIRALAFKWIRVLFRCWVDRTPYNESRYLAALQKRQSPLLKFAAQTPS